MRAFCSRCCAQRGGGIGSFPGDGALMKEPAACSASVFFPRSEGTRLMMTGASDDEDEASVVPLEAAASL